MNSPSKNSEAPVVTVSKIPSIKEICGSLGFQHASLKDIKAFMTASHGWRKSYTTRTGQPGTHLLNWNQSSVQLELQLMAESFLDNNGIGERFWSPNRSWNHNTELWFPDDRTKIVDFLKQLFWKQNRYAFNNSQYGNPGAEINGTRVQISPISSTQLHHSTITQSPRRTPIQTPENRPKQFKEQIKHRKADEVAQSFLPMTDSEMQPDCPSEQDVCEIPDEMLEHIKTPVATASTLKPTLKHNGSQSGDVETVSKKRKIKLNQIESPRRSHRKRAPRNLPCTFGEQEFEELLWDSDSDKEEHELAKTSRTSPVEPRNSALHIGLAPNIPARTSPMLTTESSLSPLQSPELPLSSVDSPRRISKYITKATHPPNARPKNKGRSKKQSQLDSPVKCHDTPPSIVNNPELNTTGTAITATITRTSSSVLENVPERHLPRFQTIVENDDTIVFEKEQDKCRGSLSFGNVANNTILENDIINASKGALNHMNNDVTSSSRLPSAENSSLSGKVQLLSGEPSLATAPGKPRSKIQIPLWIVTREPRYTEERWDDGKFQGTALSAFIEGISQETRRSKIEKIKLTLQTPTFDTKITVFKNAEDSWLATKETFVEKLKEAKAEARAKRRNESGSFKILVEPFYELDMMPHRGDIDQEDDEFEF